MKLIFIHGAGNTGFVWHYQTEYFAASDAISLPGHPQGKPCTSVDDYAEWLHRYVQDRDYSQLVLVGHSMGGAVAQMYALSYPKDVKALILIGTGARLRVRPDFLESLEDSIDAPAEWLKNIVEPPYSRVAPEVREKVINGVVNVGAAVQLNDFRCCDKFDIMDKINQIAVPTLVICGTEDDMTPVKYSQYLVNKIIGAKLVVIEGGSHHCFLEKPVEVNRAIEEFLEGL
ncbi:MAG: alpha/beta hydrolase [Dehalococcoidia bacterium]|nr:alpha/beta hydrolase [Dehalococcoidia bacterium]